jgi:hypothetical protein
VNVQLADGANEAGQLFVCAKSPLTVTVKVSAGVPVLVRFIVCG